MLRHLGEQDAAGRIERAVAAELAESRGASRTTSAIGDAIIARV